MTNEQLFGILKGMNFLRGMDDAPLRRLSEIGQIVAVPQNETLFRENELAEDVLLIASGRVAVVICTPKSGCRSLAEIGEGDLAGWSPLVERNRLSATAHAITKVEAVRLNGQQLLALCEDDPKFGFEFMRRVAVTLADRLNATRRQLLDVSGIHLPEVALESD